jgi:DNA-directed RNA polymerase specialized sigma subunit
MKCYQYHIKKQKSCEKKDCKNWVNSEENQNCIIIAADKKEFTLNDVGNLYGLTRMRICQIEKSICKKVRKNFEA